MFRANFILLLKTVPTFPEEGKDDLFKPLLDHMMPHQIGELWGLKVYNNQVYELVTVGLMFLLFGTLASKMKKGGELRGMWRILSGWMMWLRDEVVYEVMGKHHGRKFLPLFAFLFFFIAICNLLGLLPYGVGGTATGDWMVTGALATVTFGTVLVMGMKEQGVFHFWKSLIPSGVPWWLVPFMFLVELISLVAKHAALMLRLYVANTAGHLILVVFLGLVFVFAGNIGQGIGGDVGGGLGIAFSVGVSALVMIIEAFVALLQAYIFTFLSVIFIGAAIHPDH